MSRPPGVLVPLLNHGQAVPCARGGCEPVVSGTDPGWRKQNQTQKNCKLCQIDERVYEPRCISRSPGKPGAWASS